MTGKDLKAFAALLHDEAVVEFKEKDFYSWHSVGSVRATLQQEWHQPEEQQESSRVE